MSAEKILSVFFVRSSWRQLWCDFKFFCLFHYKQSINGKFVSKYIFVSQYMKPVGELCIGMYGIAFWMSVYE